jgi:hypothetical protein
MRLQYLPLGDSSQVELVLANSIRREHATHTSKGVDCRISGSHCHLRMVMGGTLDERGRFVA